MKIIGMVFLCMFFCFGFASVFQEEDVVMLYRENESRMCFSSETEVLLQSGWYEMPVCRIYDSDNEEWLIFEKDYSMYQNQGWAKEPFVSVYDAQGHEKRIVSSAFSAYVNSGWLQERPDWEGLPVLKNQIEQYLLTQKGTWGIFVQNLENNEFLSIREESYSAASLIKLFTMASVYRQMEDGHLEKSDQILHDLQQMICYSSNEAANRLTILSGSGSELAGFDNDNRMAKDLQCNHTARGSYLVEASGRKGPYRHHNRTSPRDCGRLLKAIYKKELVSAEASLQMLDLLLAQSRTWKIPAALPEGMPIANKTGETDTANHDVAIVFSPGGDYILCILGDGNVSTIHRITAMVHQHFNNEQRGENP